jgi:hypothetical protein
MSTKKLLGALALSVLLPGVALAQVTATFGAGRVYEPTCTHPTPGTIGNPIYANAPNFCTPLQAAFLTQCNEDGTNETPQRNQDGTPICSERINDVNASGQIIQTDPTFPFFTTPGQWVLEEDPPGVVNFAAPSGTAAFTVLNLDLTSVFGDVLFIISSGVTYYTGGDGRIYGTSLDGSPSPNGDAPPALPGPTDGTLDQEGAAPGTGAPSLFYPSPLPSGVSIIRFGNAAQERTGCLVCFDNAGFCSVLIDTPAGEIRCGDEIQAESDPLVRYMPTLISNDGWDSFSSVDNGDSHFNANGLLPVDQTINPGGFVEGEGILNNADDIGAATGGSLLIVKGFRGRECSTMNRPPNRYDPRKPISGRPDPDCDDVGEWVLGLGSNDTLAAAGGPGLSAGMVSVPGVPCDDLNADNSCTVQIAAPAGATGPGDCENYCTTDVTQGCAVNADCPDSGQCRQAIFTPENLCVKPGPEPLTSSALVIQSTDEHEVFPVPGTIVLEETPGTLGTCDGPIPIDPDTGNPFGSPLVCAESANCAGNCNLTGVVCIDDQFCPPLVDPVTMEVTIDSCSVDSGDPARQPAACLGASPSTLSIPLGSRSGLVNKSFLNLDIATIGVVLIQSATGVLFDGATGVGSPALVADWDNRVPYNLYGCLQCTEITETACTQIGLGPSGENICGARIQFAPPENRPRNMPDWTGVTGNFSTAADRDTQRIGSVVLPTGTAAPPHRIPVTRMATGRATAKLQGVCWTTRRPSMSITRPTASRIATAIVSRTRSTTARTGRTPTRPTPTTAVGGMPASARIRTAMAP